MKRPVVAAALVLIAQYAWWTGLGPAQQEVIEVDGRVSRFLQRHCTTCHNPAADRSRLDLALIAADPAAADADVVKAILAAISLGDMPPDSEPSPLKAERELAIDGLGLVRSIRKGEPATG